MNEEWRPVVGLEGYYSVSSFGQVRSEPGGRRLGRLMKQGLKGDAGHLYYGLRLTGPNGVITTHQTAALVAAAFLGPKPTGLQINHINGNRLNNRIENLEYVTPRANEDHAVATDLKAWGERHGMAKLTEVQVRAIRAQPWQNDREWADVTGVRVATIRNARTGKTWRRLSDLNSSDRREDEQMIEIRTHRVCTCGHGQNEHHDTPLPLDHFASGRYRVQPEDTSFCEGCVDERPHARDVVYHRFADARSSEQK